MLSSRPAVVFLMDTFDAGSFEITFEKQSEQTLLIWAWTCPLLKSYFRDEKVRETFYTFKYWAFHVLCWWRDLLAEKACKEGYSTALGC